MPTRSGIREDTYMDPTNIIDLSRSVEQICTTLSMNNVTVPRIDKFTDVFAFINEFELATATLPEDCRFKMLVKAFPPGRYHSWYEKEITPLLHRNGPWSAIKEKIISRYSDTESKDRHFRRLHDLKFVDNGKEKLYDHIEEFIFLLGVVFPQQTDDETKIRYIKSRLPPEIQSSLRQIYEYNHATTLDDLLKGAREYDRLKFGQDPVPDKGGPINTSELVSVLKELVKGVKQGEEATRSALAALRPRSREPSPGRRPPQQIQHQPIQPTYRERSPRRQEEYQHTNVSRSLSPFNSRAYQREPSPARQFVGQGNQYQSQYYQQRPRSPGFNRQQGYSQQHPADPNVSYTRYQVRALPPPQQSESQNYMQGVAQTVVPPTIQQHQVSGQQRQPQVGQGRPAFDDRAYYDKFGVPPSACQQCGLWHWVRHCHSSLN